MAALLLRIFPMAVSAFVFRAFPVSSPLFRARRVERLSRGRTDAHPFASDQLQNAVRGIAHRDAHRDLEGDERQQPHRAPARREEENKRLVAGGDENSEQCPYRDVFLFKQLGRHNGKAALRNKARRRPDQRAEPAAQAVVRARELCFMLDEFYHDIDEQQPRKKF